MDRAQLRASPLDLLSHVCLLGRFARGARTLPSFAPKHAIDLAPGPQCARIDVQIVEGHARVSVDCLLLCLKHIVILIVHAAPLVDVSALNITRELCVLFSKSSAPALRPGLIDGGSAIGGLGGRASSISAYVLHCEVPNKRKSVVRRSYPLTIFLVSSSGLGRRAKGEGKQLGRPRIAPELEARILTALKASGRTEGVREIAKRFAVDPGTV